MFEERKKEKKILLLYVMYKAQKCILKILCFTYQLPKGIQTFIVTITFL